MYSIYIYINIIINTLVLTLELNHWFHNNLLINNWVYQVDSCNIIMLLIISIISTYVHIYSLDYMIGDTHYNQFYVSVELFAYSINILVMSNNIIMLFFSWELVGLCSDFLISFWKWNQFTNTKFYIL